jgi:hypothetical protein
VGVEATAMSYSAEIAELMAQVNALPMMHRAGWEEKANFGMAFAWYVWDRSHTGPTTIDRIAWESVS